MAHSKPLLRAAARLLAVCLATACLAGPSRAQVPGPRFAALTFDDGPSGPLSRKLLAVLDRHGVSATFFFCGYRVAQYPEEAAAAAQAGHELGIHGYSHDYLHKKDRQAVLNELEQTAQVIAGAAGQAPRLFRPPGGLSGNTVQAACQELGLPIVLWSVDPEDWRCQDPDTITRRVLSQVKNGSIILMHELSESSVAAADAILERLQSDGYHFLTVSQLAAADASRLLPGQSYSCFQPQTEPAWLRRKTLVE